MKDVNELEEYEYSEFGDIGPCDVDGCWEAPDSYVVLRLNGFVQASPVFFCAAHMRKFYRFLTWKGLLVNQRVPWENIQWDEQEARQW